MEQQEAIEAFVQTAGLLETEAERHDLESRVRADLANKDRELAAALERCLKEAGREAEELAVRHAREAFEKATKKFNDDMAAASAKVAADNAAAREASTLGPRIREVAEKTARDEFLALDECVRSADALLSTQNQADALGKCLQSAAARKAAADSSAMAVLLEEARKKISAEEEAARQALLQDLLDKEKKEIAEVEECVKVATARKVAEETSKVEELYKKKAQETLALADAEVDLCVQNIANLSLPQEKEQLEKCLKEAAKKKTDTDAAALEVLVAEAAQNIEDEEKAAIHVCTQRAMKRLQGQDGAGPSRPGTRPTGEDPWNEADATTALDKNMTKSKSAPEKDEAKDQTGFASGIDGATNQSTFVPGKDDASSKPSLQDADKSKSSEKEDGRSKSSEKDDANNKSSENDDGKNKSSENDDGKIKLPVHDDVENKSSEKDDGKGKPSEKDHESKLPEKDDSKSKSSEKDDGKAKSSGKDDGESKSSEKDDSKSKSSEKDDGKAKSSGKDDSESKSSEKDDGKAKSSGKDDGESKSSEKDDRRSISPEKDDGKAKSSGKDDSESKSSEKDDGKAKSSGKDDGESKSSEKDDGKAKSSGKDDGESKSSEKDDRRSISPEKDEGKSKSSGKVDGQSQSPKKHDESKSSVKDDGESRSSERDDRRSISSENDDGKIKSSGRVDGKSQSSEKDDVKITAEFALEENDDVDRSSGNDEPIKKTTVKIKEEFSPRPDDVTIQSRPSRRSDASNGLTLGNDEGVSSLGNDSSSIGSQRSALEDETESKSGIESKKEASGGLVEETEKLRGPSQASTKYDTEERTHGDKGQYDICRKAVSPCVPKRGEHTGPQTRPIRPYETDQIRRIGQWVDGICVLDTRTQTPTRRDRRETTSRSRVVNQEEDQSEGSTVTEDQSRLPETRNECIDPTKQRPVQKKTPRAPVTVRNDYESVENCTEETQEEVSAQKKTRWTPERVVTNNESERRPSPTLLGRDGVNAKYSVQNALKDDASVKSSKISDKDASVFSTTVATEEQRSRDGDIEDGSYGKSLLEEKIQNAVSDSVQVAEEMCNEAVQTTEIKLELNTEQVQNCETSLVVTVEVPTESEKHSTEAQTALDDRPAQETQLLESTRIPKNGPPKTSAPTGGEPEPEGTHPENCSTADSVSEAMTTKYSDRSSSIYSKFPQCLAQDCENEEDLVHIEIAMCEAMARAAKFRELVRNSRSIAERERLDKKATELETIVAETAALYETGRKVDNRAVKKIHMACDLRIASKVADQSEKSSLAEDAADIGLSVAETATICMAKAEAARLSEAVTCADSPDETKRLERAAADKDALVETLQRCAAEKRESGGRRAMLEVKVYKDNTDAAGSDVGRNRSERKADEEVSENASILKPQLEASSLREMAKSAESPKERCSVERAAEGSETAGTSDPSSRDVSEKPSGVVRQGTRRCIPKKDSHGPKRNNKPPLANSFADSLREETLARRPDRRSFSCINEALLCLVGHEESAKQQCPTDFPTQQISHLWPSFPAACLKTTIPVRPLEENPRGNYQSHLPMKLCNSEGAIDEVSKTKFLEQFHQECRLPPAVTKRHCRTLAEWTKNESLEIRPAGAQETAPSWSNLPQRELKTIAYSTSAISASSGPPRTLYNDNKSMEHPWNRDDSEELEHMFSIPAKTESVGVNTEDRSKDSSQNACKTRDSRLAFFDPLLIGAKASNTLKYVPKVVESIPGGKELLSRGAEDRETNLTLLGDEHEKSSSSALQEGLNQTEASSSASEGISSASSLPITTFHGSRSETGHVSTSTHRQVTAEHSTKATEGRSSENLDQASSTSHSSNSCIITSQDDMLHESAGATSPSSGECSKLNYQAMFNIVAEHPSQIFGEYDHGALEEGVIAEEKLLENYAVTFQNVIEERVPLASGTAVTSETTEIITNGPVDSEEAISTSREKSEIFFDSMSEVASTSEHSACVFVEPSPLQADSPLLRKTFQEPENQKKETVNALTDTPCNDLSTRKSGPPDQTNGMSKSVRQSTSAMSFPVERHFARMARSSKSEHDLVVEDVILAVEATARHATRAAAARDRAFEAAGVAVRAVASEDATVARQAVRSSRAAAEVALQQAACAARESIKATSLATTSKCSRRASSLATASALSAQQDSLAAERFFSHAADALQCIDVLDSASSDDRFAASTFKQVVTSSVRTNDAAARARAHLAEAASAAEAVERIVADPSRANEEVEQLERAAAVAANEAANAAAEANEAAKMVARACIRARKIASASCRSAFAASAARHSSTSADGAKLKAAAALEAASAARTYAKQARNAVAVLVFSGVSEITTMAANSAAMVAAAKTAAARSASECSQAKAAASEAAAQITACIPADCLCISLTESTKLEAFALAKTAEAEAAASRAAEKAGNAACHAATALAVSLNVQELVARDEAAAVAVRYAAAAAQEATRLADAAAEDAEAARNEASVCRCAAASFQLPPRLGTSAESVVQIKSESQGSFETEPCSTISQTFKMKRSIPRIPDP